MARHRVDHPVHLLSWLPRHGRLLIASVLIAVVLGWFYAPMLRGQTILDVVIRSPMAWLAYQLLPGGNVLKPLGRCLFFVDFGVAILASLGLDSALRWARQWACVRALALTPHPYSLGGLGAQLARVQFHHVGDRVTRHQPLDPTLLQPATPLVAARRREPEPRYDLLPRLAITYLVTSPAIDADPAWRERSPAERGMSLLYDGLDGRAYRVGGALPRAYVVTACERAANASAALGRFADPAFDATRAVLIETADTGEAGCSESGESSSGQLVGQASIVTRSLNTLSIQVDTLEAGWLIVAESWDPGWQALLDGAPTGLVPGDYEFRALRAPAGVHTVELHYLPRSFVVGAAISALSAAALIALAGGWWWRIRQHERSPEAPE